MLVAEQNRLGQAPSMLHHELRAHIDYLRKDLARLNRDLDQTLRRSPLWRETEELLRSVRGGRSRACSYLASRIAGTRAT